LVHYNREFSRRAMDRLLLRAYEKYMVTPSTLQDVAIFILSGYWLRSTTLNFPNCQFSCVINIILFLSSLSLKLFVLWIHWFCWNCLLYQSVAFVTIFFFLPQEVSWFIICRYCYSRSITIYQCLKNSVYLAFLLIRWECTQMFFMVKNVLPLSQITSRNWLF
jgi:hypothetical protein